MSPLLRNLALTIPPLRKLYDFAMFHAQGHAESQRRLMELEQQHEALKLQLYVMRSDHQRAAVRNESLSAMLSELESQAAQRQTLEQLHAQVEALARNEFSKQREMLNALSANVGVQREMLEALSANVASGNNELAQVYSKLSGRLTLLPSEVMTMSRVAEAEGGGDAAERYLDLLEKSLTGLLWNDEPMDPWSKSFDPEVRAIGRDWPRSALTMIGSARLRNFRMLIDRALAEGVPGDILEAGVWRGGACVLARGVLAIRRVHDRCVWVADSFEGLPPPDPSYPADIGDMHSTFTELRVSLEEVQENFRHYGLLDDQVRFLKGWFADTLPSAPIKALSVLRLDGDMYSSTIQTLQALYAKVSIGGYIIVDDYILKGCKEAIHDFRRTEFITDEMHEIDGAAVYWKKSKT